MSHPVDPYRREPQRPYQQPYGQQQQYPYQQPGPARPPAGQWPPGQRPPDRPDAPPSRPPATPPPDRDRDWRLPLPGLGLVLTLLSLIVQALSLTVLPWVLVGARDQDSATLPELWQLTSDVGTHGFGGWYVLLFSYPLAALGVLLALAAVLESVAVKVVWAGLALVGLGVLIVKYGFGPFTGMADEQGVDFSTQQITTALIALAAAVAVIFMLRTALTMFRRVAGLILLGLSGVHVVAVRDLVDGSGFSDLSFGAYAPVVGYVLAAIAAIAPRRLLG